MQAGPCRGQGDPGGWGEAAGRSGKGEWGVREAGTMPGPAAVRSWRSPRLQAVESASQTRRKHRGSVGLYYNGTSGRLRGCSLKWERLRGQEGPECRGAGRAKSSWGKMSPGREVACAGGQACFRRAPDTAGQGPGLFCSLTFRLYPEACGILVLPPGIKPGRALEGAVLTTELPRTSSGACSLGK